MITEPPTDTDLSVFLLKNTTYSVADPGFTEGGFRTVMRATRAKNFRCHAYF